MKFVRIFLQVFSVFFAFMPQDEARAGVIERTDQISSLSADEILGFRQRKGKKSDPCAQSPLLLPHPAA